MTREIRFVQDRIVLTRLSCLEEQTQAGINEETLGNFCTALAQINTKSFHKKSSLSVF